MNKWDLSKARYSWRILQVFRFFIIPIVYCLVGITNTTLSLASESDSNYLRKQRQKIQMKELETCSWLVTYRNRIYDLSPLTRKHLDRALEGDIQGVIRRVPEATVHLDNITKNNRDMKVHTGIATLALASFLGIQIAHSVSKKKTESREYIALNVTSLLIFARAAYAGWELKDESNEELMKAVQAFNRKSEDPILPYQGGGL